MEGLIFDIKRFAINDGPGLRTTVFLKGCPLKCLWCHNPEGISFQPQEYIDTTMLDGKEYRKNKTVGKRISVDELMRELLKDRIFMEEGKGGVTFSGGEPLSQSEFVYELLIKCKQEGFHTVIDTSGYVSSESLEKVLPYTDLFLYDIKFGCTDLHEDYTGHGNGLVWSNLRRVVGSQSTVIVRIPVVTGINDTKAEIKTMVNRLSEFKSDNFNEIHLLAYHKLGAKKYQRFSMNCDMIKVDEPDKASLEAIAVKMRNKGFNVLIHN